jgi:prefoldin subunit 5
MMISEGIIVKTGIYIQKERECAMEILDRNLQGLPVLTTAT